MTCAPIISVDGRSRLYIYIYIYWGAHDNNNIVSRRLYESAPRVAPRSASQSLSGSSQLIAAPRSPLEPSRAPRWSAMAIHMRLLLCFATPLLSIDLRLLTPRSATASAASPISCEEPQRCNESSYQLRGATEVTRASERRLYTNKRVYIYIYIYI